jgi:hypothetical protein
VAAIITEDTWLHHPTTDHLRELGLVGMARALEEMRRQPNTAAPTLRIGLPSWSTANDWSETPSACTPVCASPGCACRRRRKMLIIAPLGALIARYSRS